MAPLKLRTVVNFKHEAPLLGYNLLCLSGSVVRFASSALTIEPTVLLSFLKCSFNPRLLPSPFSVNAGSWLCSQYLLCLRFQYRLCLCFSIPALAMLSKPTLTMLLVPALLAVIPTLGMFSIPALSAYLSVCSTAYIYVELNCFSFLTLIPLAQPMSEDNKSCCS